MFLIINKHTYYKSEERWQKNRNPSSSYIISNNTRKLILFSSFHDLCCWIIIEIIINNYKAKSGKKLNTQEAIKQGQQHCCTTPYHFLLTRPSTLSSFLIPKTRFSLFTALFHSPDLTKNRRFVSIMNKEIRLNNQASFDLALFMKNTKCSFRPCWGMKAAFFRFTGFMPGWGVAPG